VDLGIFMPRGGTLRKLRLESATVHVDVRLLRINRRWLASADGPEGPTLGCSSDGLAALYLAVDAFQPAIDPLLDSLPALVEIEDR